jgi:hypothetical protein
MVGRTDCETEQGTFKERWWDEKETDDRRMIDGSLGRKLKIYADIEELFHYL